MKNLRKILLLTLLVIPFVLGCSGYDLGKTLKNDVYVVFTGDNGLDQITYTFNDDGASGDWVEELYTFGAATADATTYDLESWFRTGGGRGTFTYDNDTKTLVITYTDVWDDLVGTGYEADYDWYLLGSGDDGMTSTIESTVAFTQDGVFEVFTAVDDADDTWESVVNVTEIGGAYENITHTYEIVEGWVIDTMVTVENRENTLDQNPENTNTLSEVATLGITRVLVAGDETGDTAWTRIWKEGNIVQLSYDRVLLEIQDYDGEQDAVEPTAQELTDNDGVFETINAGDTWLIDERQGITNGNNKSVGSLTFVHAGDYIYDASFVVSISRSVM